MHAIAQQHAQPTGEDAHQRELKRVACGNGALAQAQHAQHGAVVQMIGGKGAGRQGHGHRAEQGCQQRDQAQKFIGTVQRLAHLGAATLQRFNAQPTQAVGTALLDLRIGPSHKALHGFVFPGHGHSVGQAAGGLDQLGRGDVLRVDHHPRGEIHEACAAVGLDDDDGVDLQLCVAQKQRVTHLEAQRFQKGTFHPGLAGRGNGAGGRIGRFRRAGHTQCAAQWVAGLHHFKGHQLGRAALRIGRARHGGEADGRYQIEPKRTRLGYKVCGCGVVTGNDRIATQQLARITLQTAFEPVGEEAYGGECRYCQRDGHNQQPQIAGAQVPPQGAPTQCPK